MSTLDRLVFATAVLGLTVQLLEVVFGDADRWTYVLIGVWIALMTWMLATRRLDRND